MTRESAVCLVCGEIGLKTVPEFSALPRVTSDSKPWPAGGQLVLCPACGAVQKVADAAWRAEAAAIYGAYTMYHHSAGVEQSVFDAAGGAPRSERLVRHLVDALALPATGALLDVGCSNGMLLAAFGRLRPGWDLAGAEMDDRVLPALRRIPRFTTLHTGSPDQVTGRYPLITLVHSLEHMGAPVATLAALRRRLEPGGVLFVQVRDCRRDSYDLLVADHLLHFTPRTLAEAAEQAGCATVALSDDVVVKELSWIGCSAGSGPAAGTAVMPPVEDAGTVRKRVREQIAWLAQQIATATDLAGRCARFGVFGTGPAGTWLAGALGERVAFFVDEDPARIGRSHLGRPIYAPDGVPDGAPNGTSDGVDVFVPLIPEVAARVIARLSAGGRVRYWA